MLAFPALYMQSRIRRGPIGLFVVMECMLNTNNLFNRYLDIRYNIKAVTLMR